MVAKYRVYNTIEACKILEQKFVVSKSKYMYSSQLHCKFLQAEQRLVGAGLGAPGSKMLYSSAGTYRETLKQLTKARYEGTFND